nr:immunoglobulin light chain junction region [Macaca mulatta]
DYYCSAYVGSGTYIF